MTGRITSILISFTLCVGCVSKPTTNQHEVITKDEVSAFLKQYDVAWNAKDGKSIETLLSDQYIYFSSLGETTKKAETIKFLTDSAYVIHSANRNEIEISVKGNIATVSSHWVGDLSWQGETIHDNQRCGLTIAKINGNLEIISEHCVAIKQE
ncbi:nuclear transport factor 2 family protein [Pseudochryseolinea flava]|uniref:DUF4440 domain-containing protein n=1 Tax=Pseudochryseolinea flava TaxID=2059302 RepID=A0A364XZW9_9BACT|nr:nuclear transport factor 2 family protein [Pseudochryseolinea flava]RAV99349.1 hypothetical protein DQQ10_19165 [Pseudochryseolinea flava]